jgi:hypothetical protein
MGNNRKFKIFAGVCLAILVTVAYYSRNHSTSTTSLSLRKENNLPTSPTIGGSANKSNTPTNISPKTYENGSQQYTYGSFSFSYPKTWKVYDSNSNATFFKTHSLEWFKHAVVLEKNSFLLLIGINQYEPGWEIGGSFLNDKEYEDYKAASDELIIEGNIYFLRKNHTCLGFFTGSEKPSIWGIASLSEYIPDLHINNPNLREDGWSDYIQNKRGYSYVFVKFSKGNETNATTPEFIQNDIKSILETIHW